MTKFAVIAKDKGWFAELIEAKDKDEAESLLVEKFEKGEISAQEFSFTVEHSQEVKDDLDIFKKLELLAEYKKSEE